jgi:hypothetical protein
MILFQSTFHLHDYGKIAECTVLATVFLKSCIAVPSRLFELFSVICWQLTASRDLQMQ